jgi:hypothetical protein
VARCLAMEGICRRSCWRREEGREVNDGLPEPAIGEPTLAEKQVGGGSCDVPRLSAARPTLAGVWCDLPCQEYGGNISLPW